MDSEVCERGAQFLVATLTSSRQVHPDAKVRDDFARRLGVDDLVYPDERIRALGEREGFPVINLCYPFLKYVETHNVFLHGFDNTPKGKGHWNADGHRLAAEVLVPKVVELFDSSSHSDE